MYICNICNLKFINLNIYHKHLYVHKSKRKACFECQFSQCLKKFSNYNKYAVHFSRNHSLNNTISPLFENFFKCTVENCIFESNNIKTVYSHLQQHLNCETSIRCPHTECNNKTFKVRSTFRSHIFRSHKTQKNILKSNVENNCKISVKCVEDPIQPFSNLDEKPNVFEKLIFNLRCHYNVSETAIQVMTNELTEVISHNELQLQQNLLNFFKNSNINVQNDISEIFKNSSLLSELYQVGTRYKAKKLFHSKKSYVKPQQILLGRDNFHKNCYFHYIPLLETLQNLLLDKNFYTAFSENKCKNKGVYDDYNDGSIYENNLFFNQSERIELLLFQDAFETCNPIGSSKKKHKLIGIYMMIGNLPKKYRSNICNIQLVALCNDAFIKLFGFQKIFLPILNDIKKLENDGISFCLEDSSNNITYKGSVFAMLGDNLGSHQIGGFTENFSFSEYICRYCTYTRSMLKNFILCAAENRNVNNYNQSVALLNDYDTLQHTGIKSNSCLNDLKYFHVCNPGLPPCIAHDLFEGIIPLDLLLVIKHFEKKKVISFNYLNIFLISLVKTFKTNFSFPKFLNIHKKLIGKSDEILNLLFFMPYIFLNKPVDYENCVWKFLREMIEMCRLICAPKICEEQVSLLSFHINSYLCLRKACFPDYALKPKHHYISHYPELIKKFGPLKNLWTLPFEQKNKFFKVKSRNFKNFKNITESLSRVHQEYQVKIHEDRYRFHIECDDSETILGENVKFPFQKKFTLTARKIIYLNTKYEVGNYVVAKALDNGELSILKITEIFLNRKYDEAIFYGNIIKMWYNENLILYEQISIKQTYAYVHIYDIVDSKPVNLFMQNNKTYYSPKYSVMENSKN